MNILGACPPKGGGHRFSFRLGLSASVLTDWPPKGGGHLQSPLAQLHL